MVCLLPRGFPLTMTALRDQPRASNQPLRLEHPTNSTVRLAESSWIKTIGQLHRERRTVVCVRDASAREKKAMSIFGGIMSAIFGSSAKTAPAAAAPVSSTTPIGSGAPGAPSAPTAASNETAAAPAAQSSAASAQQVDVAAVLTGLAAQSKEKLDWRKSIVDLMK